MENSTICLTFSCGTTYDLWQPFLIPLRHAWPAVCYTFPRIPIMVLQAGNSKMKNRYLSLVAVGGIILSGSSARATTLDLTGGLGSGTINGAFFTNTDVGSTGTGLISSFVRVQDIGVADGFNASARPLMDDVNTSPIFTRDVQLKDIPLVANANAGGGLFYEFLLDINQTNANPWLSLDKLELWTHGSALTDASSLAALASSGAIMNYDLDLGGDSEVLLNYSFNNGSGSGDLFVYIPQSVFAGVDVNSFLTLYSMFGSNAPNYVENDGFEEWAHREAAAVTSVPDASSTLTLFGAALLGVEAFRRRFSRK